MKRILSILLCGALALSLVACSTTGSSSSSQASSSTPESSAASEVSSAVESSETVSSEVSSEVSAESSAAADPASEYYFKDNVAETEDLIIKITDYKVIPVGEPGNEYGEDSVIAFWYETTNKTGQEGVTPLTAWTVVFTAVQDNDPNMVNTLDVGSTPDESALETQMAEIKEGGTVSCAIAYVLDDETTPVTLTATKGLLGEELGSKEYPIA